MGKAFDIQDYILTSYRHAHRGDPDQTIMELQVMLIRAIEHMTPDQIERWRSLSEIQAVISGNEVEDDA